MKPWGLFSIASAIVVAVATMGCNTSHTNAVLPQVGTAGTSGTTSTPAALYSAGWSSTKAPATGLQKSQTMMVDGTQRTYDVYVTPGAPIGTPLPVTFFFHGNGGSPAQMEGYGLQSQPDTTNSKTITLLS